MIDERGIYLYIRIHILTTIKSMLIMRKQIVTFELALGHTPAELFVRLAPDHEKLLSLLNIYKQKLEEIVIIRTPKRLIFYAYTNDYSPLIALFESHGIAPRHFKSLVNTEQSHGHLSYLVGGFASDYYDEQILTCIKGAYNISTSVGSMGSVLEPFMTNAIRTYQRIHKESILGRITMSFVSLGLDRFKKYFRKERPSILMSLYK